ncbi:Uncharacterised protein [Clostridioides difficile]|nr:Uncharacterised protein [Clostridioides difficile]
MVRRNQSHWPTRGRATRTNSPGANAYAIRTMFGSKHIRKGVSVDVRSTFPSCPTPETSERLLTDAVVPALGGGRSERGPFRARCPGGSPPGVWTVRGFGGQTRPRKPVPIAASVSCMTRLALLTPCSSEVSESRDWVKIRSNAPCAST